MVFFSSLFPPVLTPQPPPGKCTGLCYLCSRYCNYLQHLIPSSFLFLFLYSWIMLFAYFYHLLSLLVTFYCSLLFLVHPSSIFFLSSHSPDQSWPSPCPPALSFFLSFIFIPPPSFSFAHTPFLPPSPSSSLLRFHYFYVLPSCRHSVFFLSWICQMGWIAGSPLLLSISIIAQLVLLPVYLLPPPQIPCSLTRLCFHLGWLWV